MPADSHALDESLHPLRAFLLHLVGHMTVDVERKGRGVVPEVFLHRLDVVAGFERGDRVAVSEVVKVCLGEAGLGHKAFEVEIHRLGAKVSARGRGKDQPHRIRPLATEQEPLLILFGALQAQHVEHIVRRRQYPHLPVLGRSKFILPVRSAPLLKLLPDRDMLAVEIHAFPRQTEHLTLAQAREQSNQIYVLIFMPFDDLQKLFDFGIIEGLDLLALNSRKIGLVGGIDAKIPQLDRALQRAVQGAVDIFLSWLTSVRRSRHT